MQFQLILPCNFFRDPQDLHITECVPVAELTPVMDVRRVNNNQKSFKLEVA